MLPEGWGGRGCRGRNDGCLSLNCQGDLLRKSMERFVGTAVGSLLAMAVLVVDDSIVPEAKGWFAREEFYLTMIGSVTMVA